MAFVCQHSNPVNGPYQQAEEEEQIGDEERGRERNGGGGTEKRVTQPGTSAEAVP